MTETQRITAFGVLAMTVVVTASNILVLHPIGAFLTWGAFTYPFAFLVTDLVNRRLGPGPARRVVYAGFAAAVALSLALATPRIAVASGAAFLAAQLLDVAVFDRLRRASWWRAPLLSSTLGSALDTALFFTLAFSATAAVVGPVEGWAVAPAPLLGVGPEAPFWVSLAAGDFLVKLAMALFALAPYRAMVGLFAKEA